MPYATSRALASGRTLKSFSPRGMSGLLSWWRTDDGGNGLNTTGDFSKIIDRAGVSHLLQSTASRQPGPSSVNGLRTALFNGVATTGDYMQTAAATMDQPLTIIMAVKEVTWVVNRRLFSGVTDGFVFQAGSSPIVAMRTGGSTNPTKTNWTVGTWAVLSTFWSGSSSTFRINRDRNAGGDPGTGNFGGMTWGASNLGALQGNVDVLEMLVFNRALTELESSRIQAYLFQRIALQIRNIVMEGDSLTTGAGLSTANTWGEKAVVSLGDLSWGTSMRATGGAKLIDDIGPRFGSNVLAYRDNRYSRNILTIWAGTNDLINSVSADTVFQAYKEYLLTAREHGFEVLAFTTLPRSGLTAAQEAQRVQLNERLRAEHSTFADGLVDVDSEALLADPSNLTYYSDGTHLTSAGTTLVAALVVSAVNAL